MAGQTRGIIETFRDAILDFGAAHSESLRHFTNGDRIIRQGEISDACFLIKEGTLRIVVQSPPTAAEVEIALRYEGEFVGETAFLQRNVRRTATVEVFSPSAILIRVTRNDLFTILRQDPGLDAITRLWDHLISSRRQETLQVLEGRITVENHTMSALLADIHNFSALGEIVWEEDLNSFLFEFVERSHELAHRHNGSFEDQGDGFKILFRGTNHPIRSLSCAAEIRELFLAVREARLQRNEEAFMKVGLGIGICSDFMSIRKREGSACVEGRVFSHAINVAAAISKYRSLPDEAEIYIDENTHSLVKSAGFEIAGPYSKHLEKLGRKQSLFRVSRPVGRRDQRGLALDEDLYLGSVFVSYAHADALFVDSLVQRLEADRIDVWRDEKEILVGDVIDRAVSEGIQRNWIVLVVLTPNSLSSKWVEREFDEASHEETEGRKILLPVLAGGLDVNAVPPRMRRKKCVLFATDFERSYEFLRMSVIGHLKRHS